MWQEALKKVGPARDSFTPHQIGLFKEAFRSLNTPGFAGCDRLAKFLETGADLEILELVEKLDTEALGVGLGYKIPQKRLAFYISLKTDDPVLILRLSTVLYSLRPNKEQAWSPIYILLGEIFHGNGRGRYAVEVPVTVVEEISQILGNAPGIVFDFLIRLGLGIELKGFEELFRSHKKAYVKAVLAAKDNWLIRPLPNLPFLVVPELVVDLAVGTKGKLRPTAEKVVVKFPRICFPLLKEKLAAKKPAERASTVQLLARIDLPSAHPLLLEHLKTEKSKEVRHAIESVTQPEPMEEVITLPPLQIPEDSKASLSQPFKDLIGQILVDLEAAYQQSKWAAKSKDLPSSEKVIAYLEGSSPNGGYINLPYDVRGPEDKALEMLLALPELTPFQIYRIFKIFGVYPHRSVSRIIAYFSSRNRPLNLRELAHYTAEVDYPGYQAYDFYNLVISNNFRGKDQTAWELVYVEQLERTRSILKPSANVNDPIDYGGGRDRVSLLKLMVRMPHLPKSFHPILWELAIAGERTVRELSRAVLDTLPDAPEKLKQYLANSDATTRLRTAQWLEDDAAIYRNLRPDVEAALRKEKSEQVRPILFNTLEALGGSLEPYLDRAKLETQAKAELKKGSPKELDWNRWNSLPVVTWADNGKPVAPEIIQFFLVKSLKLKQSDSLMRRHAARMNQPQREALARVILQGWLELDEKTKCTPEEALKLATEQADKTWEAHKHNAAFNVGNTHATYFAQVLQNFDRAKAIATYTEMELNKQTGESSPVKGVLQVAGAMGGSDLVPLVFSYMKKWYGVRASQCKALLNMVAMIDNPAAIQLLYAVRNKFRTKGIQDEAAALVEEIAERKGWTLDEMADRTIPDAGFDEKGVMELPFGKRTFTAHLDSRFEITLKDGSGKEIKALPLPIKDDDAVLAEQSKKDLSNGRKELKAVVQLQRDRLYEAMLTQRTWAVEDWTLYLLNHPIVGRYAQWLVWAEVVDKKPGRLFRPLGDGSLTDAHDNEVKLAPQTRVQLVHDCLISEAESKAWLDQLSEYAIIPPFAQFGKQRFTLKAEMEELTEIKTFEGHLIEAFKLRGRMSKLNYLRGPLDSGTFFNTYVKRLVGLGVVVKLSFSGSPVPEENKLVALTTLCFAREASEEKGILAEALPLKEVPPILLAECWNDLAITSSDGTGFDADWKVKV